MSHSATEKLVVDPVPVGRLERDWRRALADPALAGRMRAWGEVEASLAPFHDLAGLLRFLRGPGAQWRKDAVLLALLARAREDRLAARVVLEAVLPGLKNMTRRVLRDAREREEVWSVLFACAWERICCYPIKRRRRRVAANLLLDCLHDTMVELRLARGGGGELVGELAGDVPELPRVDGDIHGLLERAVAAGAISLQEAELVAQTRVDGRSLVEVAAAERVGYNTVKSRAWRAERRLLLWLGYAAMHRSGGEIDLSGCSGRRARACGPCRRAGSNESSKEVTPGP